MTMTIAVSVSDTYLWCLKPFCYLLNKYWKPVPNVCIFGFMQPRFSLPDNFQFISLAPKQYPKERWSNSIIEIIQCVTDDHILLLLEDYWITSNVNTEGLKLLHEYMHESFGNILYLSTISERSKVKNVRPFTSMNGITICQSPTMSRYQMNMQAHIWDRELMSEVFIPNEDPWTAEMQGTRRLHAAGDRYLVLGPTVDFIPYTIAMRANRPGVVPGLERLAEEDKIHVMKEGWVDASKIFFPEY